jgi:hypothetical protein
MKYLVVWLVVFNIMEMSSVFMCRVNYDIQDDEAITLSNMSFLFSSFLICSFSLSENFVDLFLASILSVLIFVIKKRALFSSDVASPSCISSSHPNHLHLP